MADYYVSTTDGRVHPITGVTAVEIVTNDEWQLLFTMAFGGTCFRFRKLEIPLCRPLDDMVLAGVLIQCFLEPRLQVTTSLKTMFTPKLRQDIW